MARKPPSSPRKGRTAPPTRLPLNLPRPAARPVAAKPSILLVVEPPALMWPHVDALVRALSAEGCEITVASIVPLQPGQRLAYAGLPGVELIACPHPCFTVTEHLAKRTMVADWLLGIEEMRAPDIIHLTGVMHAGLPWAGRTLVDLYPGTGGAYACLAPVDERFGDAAYRHGLRAAALVVTPTQATMTQLAEYYGFHPGQVIRDGRDAGRFASVRPSKEPVVLSAGAVRLADERTTPSPLERVAPKLTWPAVVMGDQNPELDGGSVSLQGVSSPGRLRPEQMLPWFTRAGIYVALTVPGPGSWIIEAALGRCALVLGDIAGLRELWDGCALFVDPDSQDALLEAIRSLQTDRRLRDSMGLAARKRAERYSVAAMAADYQAAYCDLVAGRARDQYTADGSEDAVRLQQLMTPSVEKR